MLQEKKNTGYTDLKHEDTVDLFLVELQGTEMNSLSWLCNYINTT